jgi:hypothetical protein
MTTEIFIKSLSGKSWPLFVDQDQTIGEIKEQILLSTGFEDFTSAFLIFNGSVLDNDRLVQDYNIVNMNTLHLVLRNQNPTNEQSLIKFKKVRFFKLVIDNLIIDIFGDFEGRTKGRFSGKTPKQAARKAFTAIVKKYGMNGHDVVDFPIKFRIVESTRGKRKRVHKYCGIRHRLHTPIRQVIQDSHGNNGDKVIVYNYKNNIKRYK